MIDAPHAFGVKRKDVVDQEAAVISFTVSCWGIAGKYLSGVGIRFAALTAGRTTLADWFAGSTLRFWPVFQE